MAIDRRQMEAPTAEEEDARLDICADLTERLAPLGSSLGGTLAAEAHGAFLMGCFNSSSTLEVAVTGKLPGSADPKLLVDVGTFGDSGFEHASSGIPVRLCIAYPNFALRPLVVRGLAMLEPRLRSLIQLVELWAEARSLNNPAAGTFNSWALVNLVIFAAQTFQPRPLLPPLWRVCGAADPAASGGGTAVPGPGAGGSGTSSCAGGAAAVATAAGSGGIGGGGTSSGGAGGVRPTQRLPGLTASSEGLGILLRDINARLTGPPEALGLLPPPAPGAAAAAGGGGGGGNSQAGQVSSCDTDATATAAGLFPVFHWFLVLLDRLLAHWQLSWNRRWRVSTWWGHLVQQPFNRAFLVPLECPFDPADNAAKSLGCENQPRHQQVLRGVVAEVAASLKLLQETRTPEDLDRLVLGMFGLEVEHLYLEEEGEEGGVVAAGLSEEGMPVEEEEEEAAAAADVQQYGRCAAAATAPTAADMEGEPGAPRLHGQSSPRELEDAAAAADATSATARNESGASSPAAQVRQSLAERKGNPSVTPAKVRTGSSAAMASPPEGGTRSSDSKAKSKAQRCRASPSAGAAPAAAAAATTAQGTAQKDEHSAGDLAFDLDAVRVEIYGVNDAAAGAAAAAGTATVRLPPSAAAAALPIAAATPAVLRANAMVQRPLSPLLRDVTNARQYGRSSQSSAPEPKAGPSATATAATSTTQSPGGPGESLLPFEGLFGTLLEGARRLFDNMAQGMVELGEDLNELAATTTAAIRAVINDDEDLPLLGSSSAALRRQRRQRLQLLHRGGGGTPAAAAAAAASSSGVSPGTSTSGSPYPQQQQQAAQIHSQAKQRPAGSPAPSGIASAGRRGTVQPGRPSPLRPGERGAGTAWPGAGSTTPGQREPPSPGLGTPSAKEVVAAASPCQVRSGPRRRGEEVAAALTMAAALSPTPTPPPQQQEPLTSISVADGCGDIKLRELGTMEDFVPEDSQSASTRAGTGIVPSAAAAASANGDATSDTATEAAGALSGPSISGQTAAATAAISGVPVTLRTTPVSAFDHPLACSSMVVTGTDASEPRPPPMAAAAPAAASLTDGMALAADAVADVVDMPPYGGCDAAAVPPPRQPAQAASAAALALPPLSVGLLRQDSQNSSAAMAAVGECVTEPPPASSGGGAGVRAGAARNAPPPPPPLPPPPRAPVGMGGLRVKSATFRKWAGYHDTSNRTLIQLSSGRLQELAECIDRAGPGTTIDMQGNTFTGPLAAPAMKYFSRFFGLHPFGKVTAPGLWLINGELALVPEQQLVVVAKASYVGGGELILTRCQLLLPASRGVGLQVKGKGCSAVLEGCMVRGTALAAVQASDAAVSLSGCTLEGGSGHGVCCRDNAAVTAADCQLHRFGGAAAAVLAGGSLEFTGCKLSGSAASDVGDDDAATAALDAGFRSQAALVVTAGACVSLEDCRVMGSYQGAVVGTRGGRLLATRCELSSHTSHGLSIGEGATADLRECRLQSNGGSGLRVGGVGSMAVLRSCQLSDNAGSGVTVAAGGIANLDRCTAGANGIITGAAAGGCGGAGSGCVGGHGLHVDGGGARVVAQRCGFSGNAGAGLMGCGIYGNSAASSSSLSKSQHRRGHSGSSGEGDAAVVSVEAGPGFADADLGACGGEEGTAGGDTGGTGVEVEVEAHGRISLTGGCGWGPTSGADGGGGGGGGGCVVAAAGGPERGLLVAGLGCLERLEGG
ncbi:hypothetical protein VOLCADRAFT_118047 [Volvox carteri f. nagariensis]|uniref:Right handed beta helix domain-containing protein n=1 Tax=Volvox carteri f. nagariensis TaxID=3068 RepID=D8U0E1_VOLCA|nr:uncharacterized protein VOLCADRAFT_118047 [Volvox carteri f. nagariensis]EFJ46928.1 hypothetical protein VOLCADRAFT_118047 [Volvox carteri f. nagariensis]|eukprot:XP_002952137.1 hypothetical protein VOLCADRAFT_118047 [Volvox carteri f. nagariensis]